MAEKPASALGEKGAMMAERWKCLGKEGPVDEQGAKGTDSVATGEEPTGPQRLEVKPRRNRRAGTARPAEAGQQGARRTRTLS